MIRKIYTLIPKYLQDILKSVYYNQKIKNFNFSLEDGRYITKSQDGWEIMTTSPMYFIVKDITRYEKYYQITEGDIVIDAGANEGLLSLVYAAKTKNKGKVFSFEPDQQNLVKMDQNLRINGFRNIEILSKGLWSKETNLKFHEAGTVGSSIFYKSDHSSERNIDVLSLNNFVEQYNINRLDFIKMDIEGAEIEALRGATKILDTLKPNFAIASYHFIEGEPTYKKLESFFSAHKYPYKTIFFDDLEIITYAGPGVNSLEA